MKAGTKISGKIPFGRWLGGILAACLSIAAATFSDPREAMTLALRELEESPEDPDRLLAAARACYAAGDRDQGLWLGQLAQRSLENRSLEPIERELLSWDPVHAEQPELRQEERRLANKMHSSARHWERRGFFLNAADLATAGARSGSAKRWDELLVRLQSKPESRSQMLRFGFLLPSRSRILENREAPDQAQRNPAWESAVERKTANYTVVTNLGDEVLESVAEAMEQMNRFYREVFQVAGKMDRCTIRVYSDRREYLRHEGNNRSHLSGFYVSNSNYVATYDPRSDDPPRPWRDLWSTLFHEAAHQFTDEISEGLLPSWLNEGTATYFEGAILLPDMTVEPNAIPEWRLGALRAALDRGTPTLKSVVSYYRPGSYPPMYYCVGWGLTYFLHHYENERYERIYLPFYRDYLESYRVEMAHDPFERFQEYFIRKPAMSGIATFEDFERRFRQWIQKLADDYYGEQDRAGAWVERARRQRAAGFPALSLESYRLALHKQPDAGLIRFELGQTLEELGEKDAAILCYRQVRRWAWFDELRKEPLAPGRAVDLADECLDRIRSLDRGLAEDLRRREQTLVPFAMRRARAYLDAGFPRMATTVADEVDRTLGGHPTLHRFINELQRISGVDTRRWRRVLSERDEHRWYGETSHYRIEDGEISGKVGKSHGGTTVDYRIVFVDRPLGSRYRFEAEVMTQEDPETGHRTRMLGLAFAGRDAITYWTLTLLEHGAVVLADYQGGWRDRDRFKMPPARAEEWVPLAIDVDGTQLRVFVRGQEIWNKSLEGVDLGGHVGLVTGSGSAQFRHLRVLTESRPLPGR